MPDPSPTTPASPASPQSSVAQLLNAQFSCPICNQVVVSIQGNELQYLTNHTHEVTDQSSPASSAGQGTYASLILYHWTPVSHDPGSGGEGFWPPVPHDPNSAQSNVSPWGAQDPNASKPPIFWPPAGQNTGTEPGITPDKTKAFLTVQSLTITPHQ